MAASAAAGLKTSRALFMAISVSFPFFTADSISTALALVVSSPSMSATSERMSAGALARRYTLERPTETERKQRNIQKLVRNKNNMKTCAVVNVIESSIARDSNFVLPIHCGPEIGVASTKAFLGQILVLYILALKIGSLSGQIDKKNYQEKIKDLKKNIFQ